MSTTIIIPARFNGPPDSGNGGYSAGVLANLIDGPARVSLRAPPPLDAPIAVHRDGSRLEALHEGTLVMTAEPYTPKAVPPPPPLETAHRGPLSYRKEGHPLPTCFVCGPHRQEGDGLRIFAGRVAGFDGAATDWTPHRSFGDDAGQLRPELIWSALDCPSYFAIPEGPGLALLGSMATRILRRPPAGAKLIIAAWHERSEGRKHMTGSALYSAEGELLAHADTLWIKLRSSP